VVTGSKPKHCRWSKHVRREGKSHFRKRRRNFENLGTLTKSRNKNIRDFYRGTYDFRKRYKPRTNIVKDEKDGLVADIHSILGQWRNYFCQVLNVNGVNDGRQTEIQQRFSSDWGQCLWGWNGYWKATNPQILIKFQQNWLKQGVEKLHSEIHKSN
jgi:hypothetical protein